MFSWFISSKKNDNIDVKSNSIIVPEKQGKNKCEDDKTFNSHPPTFIPEPPVADRDLASRIRNKRYNYLYYYHPEDLNEEIVAEWFKRNKRINKKRSRMMNLSKEIVDEYIERQFVRIQKERVMKTLRKEILEETSKRQDAYIDRNLYHILMKNEIVREYENRIAMRVSKQEHEDNMLFLQNEIREEYTNRLYFRSAKQEHEDLMFFLEDEIFVAYKQYLKFLDGKCNHQLQMMRLENEIKQAYKMRKQHLREKTTHQWFMKALCRKIPQAFNVYCSILVDKAQQRYYMKSLLREIPTEYEKRDIIRRRQQIEEWDFSSEEEFYQTSKTQKNASEKRAKKSEESVQKNSQNAKNVENSQTIEVLNWDEKLFEWGIVDNIVNFQDNMLFQEYDVEMGEYELQEIVIHSGLTEKDMQKISSEITWGEDKRDEQNEEKKDEEKSEEKKKDEKKSEEMNRIDIECDFSSLETFETDLENNQQNQKEPEMKREGFLELVVGPMFSGKSSKVLFKLSSMADQRFRCLYINSVKDVRKTEAQDSIVTTHNSSYSKMSPKITCIKAKNLNDVQINDFDYIAIDELQFFDSDDTVPTILHWISAYGKYVLVASLDGDCYRRKFGRVLDLIPHADVVTKMTAYCDMCRDNYGRLKAAPFTARMTSDKTAELVGGTDLYKAMCRECHDYHLDITVQHI